MLGGEEGRNRAAEEEGRKLAGAARVCPAADATAKVLPLLSPEGAPFAVLIRGACIGRSRNQVTLELVLGVRGLVY